MQNRNPPPGFFANNTGAAKGEDDCRINLSRRRKDTEGVEGIVLRKGGDVGRRGGSGEMVAV